MRCEICTLFSGRIPREASFQVWQVWLTSVSNKVTSTRRKTCYESEAQAGGSLPLMFTIRSRFLEAELEKPVLEGAIALTDRDGVAFTPPPPNYFLRQ